MSQKYASSFSFERFTYIIASLGVICDQLSTRLGLTYPNIIESNVITRFLMKVNLWLVYDLSLLSITILTSYFFIRIGNWKNKQLVLLYPMIFGLFRLFVSLLNFQTILSV
jgi:hypothetical protein